MFVVDTNVLVYAADEENEFHEVCRRRLDEWRHRPAPWFLTWGICYEFLRVSTHPRVFRRPWTAEAAWSFLEAVVASPSAALLTHTDRHAELVREAVDEMPEMRGNLMHDLHIAALMREHGISRIVTRDTDFHRFPHLEVIDPLR